MSDDLSFSYYRKGFVDYLMMRYIAYLFLFGGAFHDSELFPSGVRPNNGTVECYFSQVKKAARAKFMGFLRGDRAARYVREQKQDIETKLREVGLKFLTGSKRAQRRRYSEPNQADARTSNRKRRRSIQDSFDLGDNAIENWMNLANKPASSKKRKTKFFENHEIDKIFKI